MRREGGDEGEGVTPFACAARPVEVKDGQLTIEGWGYATGKCLYLSKVAVRGTGADEPAKAVRSL